AADDDDPDLVAAVAGGHRLLELPAHGHVVEPEGGRVGARPQVQSLGQPASHRDVTDDDDADVVAPEVVHPDADVLQRERFAYALVTDGDGDAVVSVPGLDVERVARHEGADRCRGVALVAGFELVASGAEVEPQVQVKPGDELRGHDHDVVASPGVDVER